MTETVVKDTYDSAGTITFRHLLLKVVLLHPSIYKYNHFIDNDRLSLCLLRTNQQNESQLTVPEWK